MKKTIIATLLIILIISVFISGCAKQQVKEQQQETVESAGEQVTGSITEVDNVDSELNDQEVGTKLGNLENDLANW